MSKVTGLNSIHQMIAKLQGLPDALGQTMVVSVKQKTPVRTGALRDGWSYEIDGPILTVGDVMDYAIHVEFGTYKMAPRAMLSTTLLEVPQMVKTYLES